MRVLAVLLLITFVITFVGPADAQQHGIIVPRNLQADQFGPALVATFSHFCLDQFPGRVEEAAPGRLRELPTPQVRDLLHDDPGRAWAYRAPDGLLYTLTIEPAPSQTCAVRRSYEVVPDYRPTWDVLLDAWAAAQGRGPLQDGPPQTVRRSLLQTRVHTRLLPGRRPNDAADVLMAITTTYPDGHVEQILAHRIGGE